MSDLRKRWWLKGVAAMALARDRFLRKIGGAISLNSGRQRNDFKLSGAVQPLPYSRGIIWAQTTFISEKIAVPNVRRISEFLTPTGSLPDFLVSGAGSRLP